jgi:hypothetical protein
VEDFVANVARARKGYLEEKIVDTVYGEDKDLKKTTI